MTDDTDEDAARSDVLAFGRYTPTRSAHARQRLQEGVYYLERERVADAEGGPTHCEVRALFTADAMGLTRKDARDLLWDNRGPAINFHRIILSPRASLGLDTIEELQRWTRDTMAGYSDHLGRPLEYVAAVHTNVNHWHVHVMVAGGGGINPATGKAQDLRFSGHDYKTLKQIGRAMAARITAPKDAARTLSRQRDMAALVERARSRQQGSPVVAQPITAKEEAREGILTRMFGRGR